MFEMKESRHKNATFQLKWTMFSVPIVHSQNSEQDVLVSLLCNQKTFGNDCLGKFQQLKDTNDYILDIIFTC